MKVITSGSEQSRSISARSSGPQGLSSRRAVTRNSALGARSDDAATGLIIAGEPLCAAEANRTPRPCGVRPNDGAQHGQAEVSHALQISYRPLTVRRWGRRRITPPMLGTAQRPSRRVPILATLAHHHPCKPSCTGAKQGESPNHRGRLVDWPRGGRLGHSFSPTHPRPRR